MGWDAGENGGTGGRPGPVPGPLPPGASASASASVPGRRLDVFAGDGSEVPVPSWHLGLLADELSGAERRCPGASDNEVVGLVRAWAALESWAAGAKLGVIRELIRRDAAGSPGASAASNVSGTSAASDGEPGAGGSGDLPGSWSASLRYELAQALACSTQSAETTVWLAWEQGARLPGTGALLDGGILTYAKARAVTETFRYLSGADAARAEGLILDQLAGKTFTQVLRLAEQTALTVDPELAERRREQARKYDARVTFLREPAGTAALSGRDLPPDEALAAMASVNARADEYRDSGAFGDVRMDVLRAQAYLDLLNGITADARIAGAEPCDEAADAAQDLAWARGRAARDNAGPATGTRPADAGPETPPVAGPGPAPATDPGDHQPDVDFPGDDQPGGGGPGVDDPGDDQPGDGGPGEDGPGEDGPGEDGPGEDGPGEDGPGGGGPGGGGPGGGGPGGGGPGVGGPGHGGRGGAGGTEESGSDSGPGPGGPGPGGPGPGGPWPGAGAPPGGRALQRRPPDLTVPLATLLGLAERPGEIQGFGLLDPALARQLAAAAAASPHTTVCLTVTSPEGHAVGHGCTRPHRAARPDQTAAPPGPSGPAPAGLPARLNLTIPAVTLSALVTHSENTQSTAGTGTLPWALTPSPGTGPPGSRRPPGQPEPTGGYGTWVLTLSGGRQLTVRLDPVPTYECDHRYESHGYQPSGRLRHLVQVRDGTCTFPSCNRHARESDFEHALPYDQGGKTCGCNAGARSRACHRIKQSPGWQVTQPRPGWHQWTTPAGRIYTQGPKRYTV
jgi:hypothetical protein